MGSSQTVPLTPLLKVTLHLLGFALDSGLLSVAVRGSRRQKRIRLS